MLFRSSMAISALEKEVGGPLFDRKNKRLYLNERGLFLYEKMTPLIEETADHIQNLKKGLISGKLTIGASTTIGNYVLPQLISEFLNQQIIKTKQDIDIQLVIENTATIEEKLKKYDLDMALVEGPITDHTQLMTKPWIEDELIIITHEPIRALTQQNLKTLSKEKWVLRESGSGTRTVLSQILDQSNIQLTNTMTMGHTEAVKQAVKAGLGISCLSKLSVQQELDQNTLFQIPTTEKLSRTLSIVTAKNRYETRLQTIFLSFLNATYL